jgi:hypothetical protein
MPRKTSAKQPTVTAKCVGCGKTREIGPGEIPKGDQPMCDECYMPMVAVSAQAR